MLVSERDGEYRIVAQTEHATMVGRFAERWGNDHFASPVPMATMRIVAYGHDNGWWEWDIHPHRDDDGTPVNLFEVPTEPWERFYRQGIDNVVEVDPYAGLIVSLHGAGVRRGRYGTVPSMPDRSDEYAAFIEHEEARQRRLVDELQSSDRYGTLVSNARDLLSSLHRRGTYDGESAVWRSYRLLQSWDRLSLHLCLHSTIEATSLEATPLAPGENDVALTVEPEDETTVRLDPYPFDTSPFVVRIRARRLPKVHYDDEDALVAAFYESELESVAFTVRR